MQNHFLKNQMKLDKFPMHYVLEDKITGILFPNVGAHDFFLFHVNFSRLRLNLNFFNNLYM